jgi:hypothetical protein
MVFSSSYNLADIFMGIGTLMILYYIFVKDKEVWYEGNTRKQFLVMPQDQLRIASYFAVSAFFITLIIGTFSITFLKNHVPRYILDNNGAGANYYFFFFSISGLYIISSFLLWPPHNPQNIWAYLRF